MFKKKQMNQQFKKNALSFCITYPEKYTAES